MPLPSADRRHDLLRIAAALCAAAALVADYRGKNLRTEHKPGHGPVTELDRAINVLLRQMLPQAGEGWLSEESPDDLARLSCARVWIVDPIDGTSEMLAGVPEWGISIGLAENGRAVAGGVCNPRTGETFAGAEDLGVTLNGKTIGRQPRHRAEDALVLASRRERRQGEWKRFRDAPFQIREIGSAAYKLALVASGRADATWTFRRKWEWDVAGGAALVLAAGGIVETARGEAPHFNQRSPRIEGMLGFAPSAPEELRVSARAAARAKLK